MKRIAKQIAIMFSMILGFVLLSGLVDAQMHHPDPPQMLPDSVQIARMITDLSETLKLTPDQKVIIEELHFAHFKETEEMMEKGKQKHELHKQEMDALRSEFEAELMEELSDMQKVQFERFKKHQVQKKGNTRSQPKKM